jgi:hypothetical protein
MPSIQISLKPSAVIKAIRSHNTFEKGEVFDFLSIDEAVLSKFLLQGANSGVGGVLLVI